MLREEFIKTCVAAGYANKKIATWYADKKSEFSENDFIEIFRMIESAREVSCDHGKFRDVEGVRTTKRFK